MVTRQLYIDNALAIIDFVARHVGTMRIGLS